MNKQTNSNFLAIAITREIDGQTVHGTGPEYKCMINCYNEIQTRKWKIRAYFIFPTLPDVNNKMGQFDISMTKGKVQN